MTEQERGSFEQLVRAELVGELEEALGQLQDLRRRIEPVEKGLETSLQVLRDESAPLDIAGLPALLAAVLVGRGSFTERTAIIERAIEHSRAYQRALQLLREAQSRSGNG